MATVTSISSGAWSTGANWSTGIAPVNGDKVYIAHTASGKSTFSTNTAGYAIGATAITLTGTVLAGSFVVGESVTFYGDPNYYNVTAWNSVTKVLTVAPLIIAIPAAATRVTARGHVITVDTNTIEGGDDTTTAINVTGTLKWSRTANSQLTVQGELLILTKGTFDMGQSADPIPLAYTATLKTNRSATLADGEFGVTFQDETGLYIYGAAKTTNALLVSDIAVGATTARVTNGVGWNIGDRLVFASTSTSATEQDIKTIATITLVSGTIYDVTFTATTYGHKANCPVSNLTNNCIITCYNTTYRSYFDAMWNTGQLTLSREMRYVTFEEFATNTVGGVFAKQAGLTIRTSGQATVNPWISVGNIAIYQTLSGSGGIQHGNNKGRYSIDDVALYMTTGTGILGYAGGVVTYNRMMIHRTSSAVTFGYSEGTRNHIFNDCYFTGFSYALTFNGGIQPEFNRCYFFAGLYTLAYNTANSILFNSCYFGSGGLTPSGASVSQTYITMSGVGGLGNGIARDCYFDATKTTVGGTWTQGESTLELSVVNKNAVVTAHELHYPNGKFVRDNSVISRGKSSIAYTPYLTTAKSFKTIYIPASNGVALTIKGRLRKNASYGASTRPTVTLSGLGITPQSFTMTDTTDTWEEFTFTATQSSGNDGSLELLFTCQSSSTSAIAYLDGVLYDPFVQYKDFYGYSYAPTTPALTVDPVITEATEATVAAYTGISIAAGVITMTTNHTIQELYDYCQYHRVANQLAPFFTSADGVNFTSDYDITMTGANLTGTGVINMPSNTLTMTGGAISSVYIYALNGNTGYLNVTGLGAHSVLLQDGAGSQLDYNASVTGTYSCFVPVTATGTWKAVIKKAGYEHQVITFLSTTGGAFGSAANTPQKITADGLAMYTGATSALVAVTFTGTTQANIDIANGTATLQASFDESEVALCTNDGLTWIAAGKDDLAIFNSASGDYLFMTDDWRLRRASAGDNDATLQAFAISTQGVVVDGTNGGVMFLTSDTPEAIAAEILPYLQSINRNVIKASKIIPATETI
jgi:hypothetical protein